MKIRTYVLILVLTTVISLYSTVSAMEDPSSKPNKMPIPADDLVYGDVDVCDRRSKAPKPHMDTLAQQGRRFTEPHFPASVRSPTRYAIHRCRYAWRTRLKLGMLNA